ncbi:unnamed protein product [Prorocentrum cordatum]|uniref:Uncharacterized protein n=1 Tax=Prorocentrum cordatum TaxID=2364126 RepID=A0ABN9PUV3_9DINO|nr:unnamed protein product [Polarella glacialis]
MDATAVAAAASCPRLRSVSLSSLRCDASAAALLGGCPELTALDLAGCQRLPCSDPERLRAALAASQGRLRSLKLGDCERLATLRGLGACCRLQMVRMWPPIFLGGCSRLGDASGLGDLLAGCAPSLEFASLVGCHGFSPSGLRAALRGAGGLPALRTLVLGGCRVDDGVCEAIGEACCALESLDLWNCGQVTDRGVLAVLGGGPPLSEVNLRECPKWAGPQFARSARRPASRACTRWTLPSQAAWATTTCCRCSRASGPPWRTSAAEAPAALRATWS